MTIQRVFLSCVIFGWAAILLLSASLAPADVITPADVVTPDLPPGSPYQLIFLTHETTQASRTDIGYYNDFVTDEAQLGVSQPNGPLAELQWRAIASTSAVNAKDNVLPILPSSNDIPIYTTSGDKVADSAAALWQTTSSTSLLSGITADQYGDFWVMDAWTGTQRDGTAASDGAAPRDRALGQWTFGPATNLVNGPEIGCGAFTTSRWLDAERYYSNRGNSTQALSLYALSSVVTVPDPVPEPSMLMLLAVGAASVLAVRWRRRVAKG